MIIKIKVHANSTQEKIKKLSDKDFEVWLKQKPINGKANEALIKFLKKEFNKQVKILSGFNSNIKKVEIR